MRRISFLLLIFFVITMCFCGCGDSRPTLKIYNAGKYIDPTVIDDFEEQYGCRVIYDEFDSNESMYVQVANDSYTYDVVVPSDYMIDRLIQEDRLAKLDKALIPNIENIDSSYLKPVYDTNNDYSVPYMVGTVGIMYNKSMNIDEEDISWNVLFDEKYKGQIFMLDSVRDALGIALIQLGYSVNETDSKKLEQAKDLLVKQKPLVQAYITDEMVDKMIAGEGLMTLAYSGEAAYAMSQSDDLTYAVPKEGSNKWSDSFVVLKTGCQQELAMKFINFMCQPEIAQRNMYETGYVSPVLGTKPEMETDTEVYYPSAETLEKCEAFTYSAEVAEKYTDLWTHVQVN